jgi:hypothetical protein
VHPADIQDRDGDGGVLIFSTLFGMYRFCKNFLLTGAALGVAAQGRPRVVIAKGFDAAFGFLHDGRKPGRLSLVWDCVEPLRPGVSAVFGLA